jgi:NADH-quinone oxidoreductase subunit A
MAVESFITAAVISITISIVLITLTFWGYNTKIDIEKTSIYECGFTPYSQARSTYDIKFYLVSLLFIVFDVEVLFLFPFALNKEDLTMGDLNWILFFIIFIFLGIFYEIKSKVLEF